MVIRFVAYVVTGVHIKVSVHISLVGTIYSSRHAWPCLLESEYAINVVAMNLFTGDRVDDGGLNAEKWERGTAGFCRSNTG